jgi:predicted house-cleaning noncanonical NTP pyrophosphatase (MazG superfamily)
MKTKDEFITKCTRIISDMLDNPDKYGIYLTTKCFNELDALFDEIYASQSQPEKVTDEESLFNSLSEFVFNTFPDASCNDHLKKLKIEADEAMQDNRESSEFADCLMAVYGAAAKAGFSYEELIHAGFEKLKINKTREWKRLDDGTYQHI